MKTIEVNMEHGWAILSSLYRVFFHSEVWLVIVRWFLPCDWFCRLVSVSPKNHHVLSYKPLWMFCWVYVCIYINIYIHFIYTLHNVISPFALDYKTPTGCHQHQSWWKQTLNFTICRMKIPNQYTSKYPTTNHQNNHMYSYLPVEDVNHWYPPWILVESLEQPLLLLMSSLGSLPKPCILGQ